MHAQTVEAANRIAAVDPAAQRSSRLSGVRLSVVEVLSIRIRAPLVLSGATDGRGPRPRSSCIARKPPRQARRTVGDLGGRRIRRGAVPRRGDTSGVRHHRRRSTVRGRRRRGGRTRAVRRQARSVLVIFRVALAVASVNQSARLSTGVVAGIRSDLASAYLDASWSSQHGERGGRLQELLTTFANQGATLVNAVAQGVIAGFTLVALLIVAVIVDPLSSLVVIVAVLLLALVLRPLRAAVKRQARADCTRGHGVRDIAQRDLPARHGDARLPRAARDSRPGSSTRSNANEAVNERLQRLKGLVPAVYSGLAYIALIAALGAVVCRRVGQPANRRSRHAGHAPIVELRPGTPDERRNDQLHRFPSSAPSSRNSVATRQLEARISASPSSRRNAPPRRRVVRIRERRSRSCTTSTARSSPARSSGSSGHPGAGSRPSCNSCSACAHRHRAPSWPTGETSGSSPETEWARRVTFVPQEAHLIAGTVGDNIRFFRDGCHRRAGRTSRSTRPPSRRHRRIQGRVRPPGRRAGQPPQRRTEAAADHRSCPRRIARRDHPRRTHERARRPFGVAHPGDVAAALPSG